jgi:hypothetical protein
MVIVDILLYFRNRALDLHKSDTINLSL